MLSFSHCYGNSNIKLELLLIVNLHTKIMFFQFLHRNMVAKLNIYLLFTRSNSYIFVPNEIPLVSIGPTNMSISNWKLCI